MFEEPRFQKVISSHVYLFPFLEASKKYGVPPNHPFLDGFSMINHPAIGVWKPLCVHPFRVFFFWFSNALSTGAVAGDAECGFAASTRGYLCGGDMKYHWLS